MIQQADSGVSFSKKEALNYLLQGTVASHLEKSGVEETDTATRTAFSSGMLYILTISVSEYKLMRSWIIVKVQIVNVTGVFISLRC